MASTLEQFIEALRNELQQFGEMLALLETQQGVLTLHGTSAVAATVSSLNAQRAAIDSARCIRENLQRQVAWSLGVPEEQTVRQLVPLTPPEYQPLLEALTQEIPDLLARVRRCARDNHEHLRRSLTEMEAFMTTLSSPTGLDLFGHESSNPDAGNEPPLPGIATAA